MSTRWALVHDDIGWTGTARAMLSVADTLARAGTLARIVAPAESAVARRAAVAGFPTATWAPTAPPRARAAACDGIVADGWLAASDTALALAATLTRQTGRGTLVRRVAISERIVAARRGWFRRTPEASYLFAARLDAEKAVLPPGCVRGGVLEPWAAPAAMRATARPAHVVLVPGPVAARAHEAMRGAAALLAAHADLRLVLLGDGGRDDALRVHAGALGVAERVVFGGDFDAPAWLATAAAAWVVADGDDGAYAALAAASHGVPVLATRGSSAARAVAPGVGGEAVPGDEPLVAAATLAQWLGDAERRRALGRAARERLGVLAPPVVTDVLDRALAALRGARAGAA